MRHGLYIAGTLALPYRYPYPYAYLPLPLPLPLPLSKPLTPSVGRGGHRR